MKGRIAILDANLVAAQASESLVQAEDTLVILNVNPVVLMT